LLIFTYLLGDQLIRITATALGCQIALNDSFTEFLPWRWKHVRAECRHDMRPPVADQVREKMRHRCV